MQRVLIVWLCLVGFYATTLVQASVPLQYKKKPDEWFRTDEGRKIVDNIVTWQSPAGGWPKNGDTASQPYAGERDKIEGTFDNGATTGELEFLARSIRVAANPAHRAAFDRGLELIFTSQYPTGGWPQRVPTGTGYGRHITFNDGSMVHIMELLLEIVRGDEYPFVSSEQRQAAQKAFDRGVDCIVKCQIKVKGRPTAWCAQHDAVDLTPQPARAYELVSLSGAESAGILKLLMRIERPTPEVRRTIEDGVAWFESAKLTGIRVDVVNKNKVVVEDAQAPPLWARFYEIDSNRPFFCGRDGVKKYSIAEIEAERRNGYAWYGTWGSDLSNALDKWKKKMDRLDAKR